MRIAFVCSSLEPGRDGVGDYCQGMAEELDATGHQPALVGINDRFCEEPLEKAVNGLRALRLPRSLDFPARVQLAAKFLDDFQPDWVSLQFVSYGFNPKGIVAGLGPRLKPLTAGRAVHLMLHELWLGAQRAAPLKDRLVGFLQRAAILSFIKTLKPQKVHVTNRSYQGLLAKAGVMADVIPLFGNIPIAPEPHEWIWREIAPAGVTRQNRGEFCILGIFGASPRQWVAVEFFPMVLDAAEKIGKRIVFLTIGNQGAENLEALRTSAAKHSVPLLAFGVQPAERISEFLQALDFGVATGPWSLTGKSSATAAMLEHGLPVLILREDVDYGIEIPEDPRLIRMRRGWSAERLRTPVQTAARTRGRIAAQFIDDLTASL